MRPLQLAVLRPNGPLPGDQPPPADALHVAALRDGVVIGAATVLPERWPGPGMVREPAWRLRGMVVAEAERGTGIGRAVLDQAVVLAAASGRRLAVGRGPVLGPGVLPGAPGGPCVGDEWIKPGIGPHRYIRLRP